MLWMNDCYVTLSPIWMLGSGGSNLAGNGMQILSFGTVSKEIVIYLYHSCTRFSNPGTCAALHSCTRFGSRNLYLTKSFVNGYAKIQWAVAVL
jgi:hypothetical protein